MHFSHNQPKKIAWKFKRFHRIFFPGIKSRKCSSVDVKRSFDNANQIIFIPNPERNVNVKVSRTFQFNYSSVDVECSFGKNLKRLTNSSWIFKRKKEFLKFFGSWYQLFGILDPQEPKVTRTEKMVYLEHLSR